MCDAQNTPYTNYTSTMMPRARPGMLLHLIRTSIAFGVICVLVTSAVFAQDPPGPDTRPKWGKIPESQLRMEHFPADTLADAVILSDYGTVEFRDDFTVIYDRHTRIKILTDAGTDWGTVTVPYRAERGAQKVRDVQGQTFTIDESGRVQKHKMDKKSVFTEDVNGVIERIRFTLPAVAPGAVIEYSYQVMSEGPQFMPSWQFQHGEPVVWSEFVAEIPAVYSYVRKVVGRHPYAVESAEELVGRGAMENRWAMKDIPALREEPYMTTPDDYRSAIEFQLAAYMSSVGWADYLASWTEVASELLAHPNFGGQLNASRAVRSQVDALTTGVTNPMERLRRIHEFVSGSIVWNDMDGWLADTDGAQVLSSKSGSRVEIHLLLVSMLREAGLNAYPVLISTRSNGQPIEEYPILTQFNSTVVAVEFRTGTVFLDATNPFQPMGQLPSDALNQRGWLVREPNPAWISIKSDQRYQHDIVVDGKLQSDGTLVATVRSASQGYAAVGYRRAVTETGSAESFVSDHLLEDYADVSMQAAQAANLDSLANAFEVEATLSIPSFAQTTGDFMFFTPVMLERFDENPLRLPERTFPVDTSYPISISSTYRLELPEGWSVEARELPQSVRTRLPRDGGFFRRGAQVNGNALVVETTFRIDRTLFEASVYDDLRSFFESVVTAQNEQIVLSRTSGDM